MLRVWLVLCAIGLTITAPNAGAWAKNFTADLACSDVAGTWVELPDGQATIYHSGTYGSGHIILYFMDATGAAKIAATAFDWTDSMDEPLRLEFGAGQKICFAVSGSTDPDINAEIMPMHTRGTAGDLKLRY